MILRALLERLKHLPGKHDQSSHGRRGRAGTAFRSAYMAARAEGKTHSEAWNHAKTAAEKEREAMRVEKRAAEQANPKPKRAQQPQSKRPPIEQATSYRDYSPQEIAAHLVRQAAAAGAIDPKTTPEYATFRRAREAYDQAVAEYDKAFRKLRNNRFGKLSDLHDLDVAKRAAYQELLNASALYRPVQEATHARNSQILDQIWGDFSSKMQHPTNPWRPQIKVSGGTPEERQRATVLIHSVTSMFEPPMLTGSLASEPIAIARHNAPVTVQLSSARAKYNNASKKIGASNETPYRLADSTIHESFHLVQEQYTDGDEFSTSTMRTIPQEFGKRRTNGETKQKLQTLEPHLKYDSSEIAYRDAVDDPYTLKVAGNIFEEVLTMAFTDLVHAHERKDTELLVVGIRTILEARQ